MSKKQQEKIDPKQNLSDSSQCENSDDYLNFINKKCRYISKKLKEINKLERVESLNQQQTQKISKKQEFMEEQKQVEYALSLYIQFVNENQTVFQKLQIQTNEIQQLKDQLNGFLERQLIDIGIQTQQTNETKQIENEEMTTELLKSKLGINQADNSETEEEDSFFENHFVGIEGNYVYTEESEWAENEIEENKDKQIDQWHVVGQSKEKKSTQQGNSIDEKSIEKSEDEQTTIYQPKSLVNETKQQFFNQPNRRYNPKSYYNQYQSYQPKNINQSQEIVQYVKKEKQQEEEEYFEKKEWRNASFRGNRRRASGWPSKPRGYAYN